MPFACQRCGACCRWPGYVRLYEGEAAEIARHLQLAEADFIARHTRLTDDRRNLSLLETAGGACEFLGPDNACALQPVKPKQCRGFPHAWQAGPFMARCPAWRATQPAAADGDGGQSRTPG